MSRESETALYVERHAASVKAFARRRLWWARRRGLELEDLIAIGNAGIASNLRCYDHAGGASVSTWALEGARFAINKATATTAIERAGMEDVAELRALTSPAVDFERRELLRRVLEEVERLPEQERFVVIGHFLRDRALHELRSDFPRKHARSTRPVNQSRVQQVCARAVAHLRSRFEEAR